MRLKRLELRNFRNYEHQVLDFGPRTLLIGENGTGKSTVADAIQWLLTGRCRGVDGKGAGQKDLIRLGADVATVTGIFEDLGPITRTISRSGSATSTLSTDAILGKAGVSADLLGSVLSGQVFFRLHHADAKALLLRLLNVQVPVAAVPGVEVGQAVDALDLDYLEQLYNQAFTDRAAAKKALAAVYVPAEPKVVSIDMGGQSLADAMAKLKAAQAAIPKAVGSLGTLERQVRDQQAVVQQLQDAANQDKAKGALEAHETMLAEHQAALDERRTLLQAAEAEPAEPTGALDIQLREAASLIDKIERHTQAQAQPVKVVKGKGKTAAAEPHACVLSADIPCLTAISEFQGQVALLKSNVKNLEARIRAGHDRTRKVASAQQAVKESDTHVAYHQGQVTKAAAAVAAAEKATADLPGAVASLQSLQQAVTDQRAVVAEANAAVAALQDQIGDQATYEADRANHRKAADAKAKLQADVDRLEKLVDLLGPSGVRLQYLDAALQDFLAAVNAALDMFGFSISITVDPWRVMVNNQGQGVVPFDLLSKGQQLWTGLAFQLTLAALSGLDFCLVDDVEAVVGANRAVLTGLIMNAPVAQVVVAMARAATDADPVVDGLQVIRVDLTAAVGA